MWQKFFDAGCGIAAKPTGDNTQSIRTRVRGHIRDGRREVLGISLVHRDLQRRSERLVEFGHQTKAGVEGELRKRCLRTR